MIPADLPPRHLPTPVRRALEADDITAERVKRVLRQTRMECAVPLDAEGTPPDGVPIPPREELRSLLDSDEVSLDAAKARLAETRAKAAENGEAADELGRQTSSGVFKRPGTDRAKRPQPRAE